MEFIKDIHAVNRFKIQVDYPKIETAKEVQNHLTFITKHKLTNSLENLCDEYGSDKLTRINSLEVDLGTIAEEDMERQIVERFEKQISRILSGINNNIFHFEGLEGVEIINEKQQLLEYFVHYIKYGTLPWYMQSILREHSFSEIFKYLIEENDSEFKQSLYKLASNPHTRIRLTHYIDSGEIMQFFHKTLPESVYEQLSVFYKQAGHLISLSRGAASQYSGYLKIYLKEFFIVSAINIEKSASENNLQVLTKQFIDFLYNEKGISPEKWLPAILFENKSKIRDKSAFGSIIYAMQDYYFDHLMNQRFPVFMPASKFDTSHVAGVEKLYRWLYEKHPQIFGLLEETANDIVSNTVKFFPLSEKDKLQRIVWKLVAEVVSDKKVEKADIEKWTNAILNRAEQIFGVSLEQSAFKTEKSEIQKEGKAELDISVAVTYWKLFLNSGLTPFKKLYHSPAKELKRIFRQLLEMELKEAKKVIRQEMTGANLMPFWWMEEAFGDPLASRFQAIVEKEKASIIPAKFEYDYLLLITFIRTGSFPWPEIQSKGDEELIRIVAEYTQGAKKEELIDILVAEDFYNHRRIMARVFDIMPVGFNIELLNIKSDLADKGIIEEMDDQDEELNTDSPFSGEPPKAASFVDDLASNILNFSKSILPAGFTQKEYADYIFENIMKSAKKALYETAAMLVSFDKKLIDPFLDNLDKQQEEYIRKLIRTYRTKFVSISEEISEVERLSEKVYSDLEDTTDEPIFIDNAGLVLLNPYLKRLFRHFKLLDGKEFISDKAREKAVYVLQYLANKSDCPEEHELILNKILTGLPVNAPLNYEIEITDEEKEVCDGLLDAVLKHWGALKNTSRDGLRTSFLLREGSLRKEATGWRLRVEKKAYDILLGKLPWGYTMIQMPWMDLPLHTEWEN